MTKQEFINMWLEAVRSSGEVREDEIEVAGETVTVQGITYRLKSCGCGDKDCGGWILEPESKSRIGGVYGARVN